MKKLSDDKLEYLVLHNMISAKEACGVLKQLMKKQ